MKKYHWPIDGYDNIFKLQLFQLMSTIIIYFVFVQGKQQAIYIENVG